MATQNKSQNHNPEGHNQYTKGNQSRAQQAKACDSDSSSRRSSSKGRVNNPEGHNQYSKNR